MADALRKVDNNILKLDSAIEETVALLDRPVQSSFGVGKVTDELCMFAGTGIIQTMMLRGEYEGRVVDNTTDAEVSALIEAYKRIRPREIMLYSIDRATPAEQLVKVPAEELRAIGARIEAETGIHVQVN